MLCGTTQMQNEQEVVFSSERKAEEISFCTVLSDCKLYDLIEQKEKEITYVTYPNYHDETYANWSFHSIKA